MKKKNLVLIPGLATNSVLFKQYIDYLGEFFNVHCIDLPGFNSTIEPIKNPNLETYGTYVTKEVNKLNLDSYNLCGFSLGFGIINNMSLDTKCTSIIAIAPYINSTHLRMKKPIKILLCILIKISITLKISKLLWNKLAIKLVLPGYPKEFVHRVLHDTNPVTLLKVLYEIFTYNQIPKFHNLPHILLMNPEDKELDYEITKYTFKKYIDPKKLLIIDTKLPHLPKDVSKKYVKSVIPKSIFKTAINWLDS